MTAQDEFIVVLHASRWTPPPALLDATAWPGGAGADPTPVRVATPSPGVTVLWRGDGAPCLQPERGAIGTFREPGHGGAAPALDSIARDARAWRPDGLRGRFRAVAWSAAPLSLTAWVDPFRSYPLFHASGEGFTAVATDLRLLRRSGTMPVEVSRAAIYHYLNYSYVPAPASAYVAARKLPAGHRLEAAPGAARVERWWTLRYDEDLAGDEAGLAAGLRERIFESIHAHRPGAGEAWGTFLSGGTDSSSISGILARQVDGERVRAYSIGFEEAGYDELEFSRIARSHFDLDGRERRVSEADAVAAIPRLAEAYDEPFGNSSAIPTYYCARMAADDAVGVLVAGDGGDEIFGGNERYRKDVIFGAFHRSPAPVRWLGRAAAGAAGLVDLRFTNRVRNFVERGLLPNPDRFYSDDSFASDWFDTLLDPRFRAGVGRDDSLDVQRAVYASASATNELNRLMYVDLMMTIADNDLVKVTRAARAASVDVDFPYLDRALVEYTGRIPARMKVHGLKKRYLFKRAMDDVLPEAIRTKRKQGFGLPVSVWIRREGPFRTMLLDVLHSRSARERAIFEPAFVDGLLDRHTRGAWDHASELYMLLMLELWHRDHADAR